VISGRALYDAHLLELLGSATVGAMKFVLENEELYQGRDSEFLPVSVRFLDGNYLNFLSAKSS
jgi:hypothetical protein